MAFAPLNRPRSRCKVHPCNHGGSRRSGVRCWPLCSRWLVRLATRPDARRTRRPRPRASSRSARPAPSFVTTAVFVARICASCSVRAWPREPRRSTAGRAHSRLPTAARFDRATSLVARASSYRASVWRAGTSGTLRQASGSSSRKTSCSDARRATSSVQSRATRTKARFVSAACRAPCVRAAARRAEPAHSPFLRDASPCSAGDRQEGRPTSTSFGGSSSSSAPTADRALLLYVVRGRGPRRSSAAQRPSRVALPSLFSSPTTT